MIPLASPRLAVAAWSNLEGEAWAEGPAVQPRPRAANGPYLNR